MNITKTPRTSCPLTSIKTLTAELYNLALLMELVMKGFIVSISKPKMILETWLKWSIESGVIMTCMGLLKIKK